MQFSSNMTVLFAGGDPGGSRAVRECYTVFKAKGFKCFQLNHGWMREFSDNCTLTIDPPTNVQDIEFWLKKHEIDVVVFGTSLTDSLPLTIARSAGNINLVTVCVLDNWMNYRERLETDQFSLFIPTIYAVMDDLAAQGAINAGIPDSCIHVTGHPSLSNILLQYEKSNQTLPLTDGKPRFLFVSEPVSEDQGDTSAYPHFRGYTQQDVLKLVCGSLQAYHDKFSLILQPHPRENREKISQVWNDVKGKIDGEISTYKSGRDALFSSDRVLGMASILLYEAWLIGKPVISVQPNLLISDLRILSNRENVFFVDDIKNLDSQISQWFYAQSAPARPELKLHGFAADNIAALVYSQLMERRAKV